MPLQMRNLQNLYKPPSNTHLVHANHPLILRGTDYLARNIPEKEAMSPQKNVFPFGVACTTNSHCKPAPAPKNRQRGSLTDFAWGKSMGKPKLTPMVRAKLAFLIVLPAGD